MFVGGELLIRGSVTIAKQLGLSTLLIGVVIVGFGTSTPELLVSIQAALGDHVEIALGNVIGSNIANVLLILGLSAVLAPIVCKEKTILRDALAVVFASALMLGVAYAGILPRSLGVAMLFLLGAYLYYCYYTERNNPTKTAIENTEENKTDLKLIPAIAMVIGSLVTLVFGANSLVFGATSLARDAGISEAVIGLTLVAVGTSLPELAAAISAAIKKQSDIVIGNILGSCMFNIMAILAITAIIKPIPVTGQIADVDIAICLGVAVVTALIIFTFKSIPRWTGFMFLAAYAAYSGWLFMHGQTA